MGKTSRRKLGASEAMAERGNSRARRKGFILAKE
jgi:hypothetical protein